MSDWESFDDWLEGYINAAVHDVFGEPGTTPLEQVIEIEETGLEYSGLNLCGREVPERY